MLIRGEIREVWMLYNPLENHLLPFLLASLAFIFPKLRADKQKETLLKKM